MKRYEVLLTEDAERDLEEICLDLAERVSQDKAEQLLEQLLGVAETLTTFPDRGSCPQELAWLGVVEFRQVLVSHFRLIYRRIEAQVFIVLIADGRQDTQTLLERRLLGA